MEINMINSTSKNVYDKSIRRGKLGFLVELYLRNHGKNDAKQNIVREDVNGCYISPFIKQEISFFEVSVQKEKEKYEKSIMKIQAEIEMTQAKIDEKKIWVNDVLYANEEKNIEQSIAIIKARNLELSILAQKEHEIMQIRCEQIYNILLARIAVYWSGVLKANKDIKNIPPVFIIDDYLSDWKIKE